MLGRRRAARPVAEAAVEPAGGAHGGAQQVARHAAPGGPGGDWFMRFRLDGVVAVPDPRLRGGRGEPLAQRQGVGVLLTEDPLEVEVGDVTQPRGAEGEKGEPQVGAAGGGEAPAALLAPPAEARHGVQPAVGRRRLAAAQELHERAGAAPGGAGGPRLAGAREGDAGAPEVAAEGEAVGR